jgi:hypothetical protein
MKTFAWTFPEPKHPVENSYHLVELPDIRSRVRHPLWIISAFITVISFVSPLFKGVDLGSLFNLIFYTYSPMIVSLLIGIAVTSKRGLLTLLIANILYFGLFLWAYIYVFYMNSDPLVGITFLFIGLISLPVMIPLWMIAMAMHRRKNTRSEQTASSNH